MQLKTGQTVRVKKAPVISCLEENIIYHVDVREAEVRFISTITNGVTFLTFQELDQCEFEIIYQPAGKEAIVGKQAEIIDILEQLSDAKKRLEQFFVTNIQVGNEFEDNIFINGKSDRLMATLKMLSDSHENEDFAKKEQYIKQLLENGFIKRDGGTRTFSSLSSQHKTPDIE